MQNLFSAVRVDGTFDESPHANRAASEPAVSPLTEAAKHQAEKVFTNVQGTLAGFSHAHIRPGHRRSRFPPSLPAADKQAGGHALDYRFAQARFRFAQARSPGRVAHLGRIPQDELR